jgi:hypothetical protein
MISSFLSKVLHNGCAAGYEATAVPRRDSLPSLSGCAPGPGFAPYQCA